MAQTSGPYKNAGCCERIKYPSIIARSYLSVSINRFCDKGFSVWLNNFRIQHAEQLMRENPSIALKDLPEQCGYATTGTFVRNFKRCHNMSPSEFMNKLLIEQTLPKVEKTFQ